MKRYIREKFPNILFMHRSKSRNSTDTSLNVRVQHESFQLHHTMSFLANSILINATKHILIKTFNQILNEIYFLPSILRKTDDTADHIRNLTKTVEGDFSLPLWIHIAASSIKANYQKLSNSFVKPVREVCQNETVIFGNLDQALLRVFNEIHQPLDRLTEFLNNHILTKVSPWQDHRLINSDLEKMIRRYSRVVHCLVSFICIGLVLVPVIIVVLFSVRKYFRHQTPTNEIDLYVNG